MFRTLIHHWRINLAVGLGAAVATAVLVGGFLVGDSVRGSLRDLTLDRLGRIDQVLLSEQLFREALADEFEQAAPAILLRGSATGADSGSRASRVAIHGIDQRFTAMFDDADPQALARVDGQLFPSVVINVALATELEAAEGDALLLRFGQVSDIPRDTLMGETDPDDVLASQRVIVRRIIPDRGWGRFGLAPIQQTPFNAFIELTVLQRALDRRGRVNALMLAASAPEAQEPAAILEQAITPDDLGLIVRQATDHLTIESREFVLRPNLDEAIREIAEQLSAPYFPIQTYLANRIAAGDRATPYSMVAALDPLGEGAWSSVVLDEPAGAAPVPGDGEIYLDRWTADDLGARVGDRIELTYFVVGPREELTLESSAFTLAGVAAMSGLAVDRSVTPEYPGLREARDISAWDPPFPVDLSLIRQRDEDYWDEYRGAPKAFVSRETGRRLWATRFGATTSVRLGPIPGRTLEQTESALRDALLTQLSPEAFGLSLRPLRDAGLQASVGATDFSGLFIACSFFLIVSAALLVGLLFGLGVERRAGEVGLLLAVGYTVARVRRQLLVEGLSISAAGGLLGLAGGAGYAWLMMAGLRTLWRPAVGSSALYLHAEPLSFILGFVSAVVVMLLAIHFAVRRLARIAPPALLSGAFRSATRRRRGRLTPWLAHGGLLAGLGTVGLAFGGSGEVSPGLTFGGGTLLLIAGLAYFALWCRGSRRRAVGGTASSALIGMAARNSSWNPGRSILSVALVGSACFLIVAVAANRHEFGAELDRLDSASGGFVMLAEADVAIHQNLNLESDRLDLGFQADAGAALADARFFPFRLRPGDDASCLNLYRPEQPRILGVPPELVERGGFSFKAIGDVPHDPQRPWTLLDADLGPGVVPMIGDANSMQWILHLGLGQELLIEDEYGASVRLRLVGTLNKSVLQSEVLIAEQRFLEHFPGRSGYGYFLIEAPRPAAAEVAGLLERSLEPFGFDVSTTRDKLASYQMVENTYMSTFETLGGLGLLLGTIGLGVVLVRNVIERRGELATLRAFGFRRGRIGWLVLAENAFLLLVGMFVGTASALLAASPRLAAIHLQWGGLVVTLLVIAAVGMLACVIAVRTALRAPLLESLKADR